MGTIIHGNRKLDDYIRQEVKHAKTLKQGSPKGKPVQRVQEWLNFHGIRISIDGDFGAITERAVRRFQQRKGLSIDGVVGRNTFGALLEPMTLALARIEPNGRTLAQMTLAYAREHLKRKALEVGGDNKGPWVRLYMDGRDGPKQFWCAGFVRFAMRQAAETLGDDLPITGSVSCDAFVKQAKREGLFVSEQQVRAHGAAANQLKAGCLFFVRKSADDWTHSGLVKTFASDHITTIEGNTNDDGNRNGYEVCARMRNYRKKDFIRL